jgi:ABC-type Fe3+-hydroxamate transport system substrate-binding protein
MVLAAAACATLLFGGPALAEKGFPVLREPTLGVNLEPQTLSEVLAAIRQVGSVLGLEQRAQEVIEALS